MSFNPFGLDHKRILITGASSGIGRQVAISCAGMGATVILTGRNLDRLQETFGHLPGQGHSIIPANLLEAQELERVAVEAGQINGLVHSAGIAKLAPFRMLSQKHLDEVLRINVHAPLLLTRALLAKRSIQPSASIVFVGAVASEIGPVATSVYSAGKAALLAAARSLAQEIASHKMRANVVSPGYVRTPLLEQLGHSGASLDQLIAVAPLGLGEPSDVANAIVFLLSDATRWMTRSLLIIDGGLTARLSI